MTDENAVARLLDGSLECRERFHRGKERIGAWIVKGPQRSLDAIQELIGLAGHLTMQLLEAIMLPVGVRDLELAYGIEVEQRNARKVVSADLEQKADVRSSKYLATVDLERGPRCSARSRLIADTVLAQESGKTLCLGSDGHSGGPLTLELSGARLFGASAW